MVKKGIKHLYMILKNHIDGNRKRLSEHLDKAVFWCDKMCRHHINLMLVCGWKI